MKKKKKGIRVLGWIFNDNYLDYENDIVRWTGLPALASIPYSPHQDASFIVEQAEQLRKQINTWPW